MPLSRTPDFTAPIRPLYEEAFSSGDKVVQYNLELDTVVEKLQSAILSERYTREEKANMFREARELAMHAVRESSTQRLNNFTELHRLWNAAAHLDQRIILPLVFGANSSELREQQVNGLEGESVELITGLLEAYKILQPRKDYEEKRNIRGAIQESTMTALLNHDQDGQFAVLPASYYEDVRMGIDAHAYFIAEDGNAYQSSISYKSTRGDALKAKQKHPHYIVLSSDTINNLDLSISRLLVKRHEGYPGVTEKQEQQLENARYTLYDQFCQQVPETAKPISMDLPTATLIQLRDIA